MTDKSQKKFVFWHENHEKKLTTLRKYYYKKKKNIKIYHHNFIDLINQDILSSFFLRGSGPVLDLLLSSEIGS